MEKLILFLIQSTIASFICCLADRSVSGVPLFKARSFCFSCERTLRSYELVPLLSALCLRFTCPSCHQRFTGVFEWLFYEGIVPLLLTWTFDPGDARSWLCFPLLFCARQDQQSQSASTDFLWLLAGAIAVCHHVIPAALFVSLLLFGCAWCRWLGVGDVPIVVLGWLEWVGADFGMWLMMASVIGLIQAIYTKTRRIPFIPALLFSWLLMLLFKGI
ncbi:prepilin peptidase [Fructobacillus sp. W13]|uniref:Prepilin peptidase n=1 Tax=Fructobacillus apis TaxID=2935017 RepID=A0ABT0ZR99_9LACO|nr:prepilin peptidase [Fructobacillus apis]MCO0832524.1 prepilin peptidase [Fructobacillus apis]